MTVGELINFLKKYDKDLSIYLQTAGGEMLLDYDDIFFSEAENKVRYMCDNFLPDRIVIDAEI